MEKEEFLRYPPPLHLFILAKNLKFSYIFLSGIPPYAKYRRDRTKLLDWIVTNAQIKAEATQNFTHTGYAFKLYNRISANESYPSQSPSSLISISQASSRKRVNLFSWAPGHSLWATQPSGSFQLSHHTTVEQQFATRWMPHSQRYTTAPRATGKELPLSNNYPRPPRSLKKPQKSGWSSKPSGISLPAPRRIPRPKFDVSTPNTVHQAHLLFLPHDKLPRGPQSLQIHAYCCRRRQPLQRGRTLDLE